MTTVLKQHKQMKKLHLGTLLILYLIIFQLHMVLKKFLMKLTQLIQNILVFQDLTLQVE